MKEKQGEQREEEQICRWREKYLSDGEQMEEKQEEQREEEHICKVEGENVCTWIENRWRKNKEQGRRTQEEGENV